MKERHFSQKLSVVAQKTRSHSTRKEFQRLSKNYYLTFSALIATEKRKKIFLIRYSSISYLVFQSQPYNCVKEIKSK